MPLEYTIGNLTRLLRKLDANGIEKIEIRNVYGQRYIGTDLDDHIKIDIYGTPGNDLGSFMKGTNITVHGNVQDACGNTMDHGKIVVHGRAGDLGWAFDAGRKNLHPRRRWIPRWNPHERIPRQKTHNSNWRNSPRFPRRIHGRRSAGGVGPKHEGKGSQCQVSWELECMAEQCTFVEKSAIWEKKLVVVELTEDDYKMLGSLVDEFCGYYGLDAEKILESKFNKLIPVSSRPYGNLYAY